MRKLLVVSGVILMIAQMVGAAEYITKEGQTIGDVHRQVGHTLWQIRQMNRLEAYTDQESLRTGTVITYVSVGDFRDACDRAQELGDPEMVRHFKQGFLHIRYRPGLEGVRYDIVLALARQYRELHTDAEILIARASR